MNEYLDQILMNFEVHKIEAQYQDNSKPPIFDKQYDDNGLVTAVEVAETYNGTVPKPATRFAEFQRLKLHQDLQSNKDDLLTIISIIVLVLVARFLWV